MADEEIFTQWNLNPSWKISPLKRNDLQILNLPFSAITGWNALQAINLVNNLLTFTTSRIGHLLTTPTQCSHSMVDSWPSTRRPRLNHSLRISATLCFLIIDLDLCSRLIRRVTSSPTGTAASQSVLGRGHEPQPSHRHPAAVVGSLIFFLYISLFFQIPGLSPPSARALYSFVAHNKGVFFVGIKQNSMR